MLYHSSLSFVELEKGIAIIRPSTIEIGKGLMGRTNNIALREVQPINCHLIKYSLALVSYYFSWTVNSKYEMYIAVCSSTMRN